MQFGASLDHKHRGVTEAANKLPLHTDAVTASTWEQFMLVPIPDEEEKQ